MFLQLLLWVNSLRQNSKIKAVLFLMLKECQAVIAHLATYIPLRSLGLCDAALRQEEFKSNATSDGVTGLERLSVLLHLFCQQHLKNLLWNVVCSFFLPPPSQSTNFTGFFVFVIGKCKSLITLHNQCKVRAIQYAFLSLLPRRKILA